MNKSQLKEIILQQQKKIEIPLVERDIFPTIESWVNTPFVIIITGVRRTGKSTFLHQIKEKYLGYYLNFDDERLVHFTVDDFQQLYELFIELFGEKSFFYFDEIQNIHGWERFVRRLHNMRKKVFVTGSNASMLSKELGTHLTGRYLEITLYPFSFQEFLRLKKKVIKQDDFYITEKKVEIKKDFLEYMQRGGLPEYLQTGNPDHLRLLYENILYRDIISRYNLPHEKTMREFVYFVASNIAKEISFNGIKNMLQIGSVTTVKEYFQYFENSFLIFLLSTFDYSLKTQLYLGKKAYVIDHGLAFHLGFQVAEEKGKLLENLVFIELKRRKKETYYYKGKKECDFIIKKGARIKEAIQVCYELNDDNRERELKGLIEALNTFKLKTGLILTCEQREEIEIGKKKIIVRPVYQWLLEANNQI